MSPQEPISRLEKFNVWMAVAIFVGLGIFITTKVVTLPPENPIGYLYITPFYLAVFRGLYLAHSQIVKGNRKLVMTDSAFVFVTLIAFRHKIDSRDFGLMALMLMFLLIFLTGADFVVRASQRKSEPIVD